MTQAPVPTTPHPHQHLTLNTDGRRHPRENALTVVAGFAALVAVVCAFLPALHVLGGWAGIVAIVLGALAQYLSATTAERWIDVPAMVFGAVGLAFALANGGLW